MKRILRVILLILAVAFIGSCGGSGSNGGSTTRSISGYVIDDPVVGATIEVYDDKGNLIAKKENATDETGYFEISNVSVDDNQTLHIIANKDTLSLSAIVYPQELKKNIYVTNYTTALLELINFATVTKNINLNFGDLKKELSFEEGKPTNKNSPFYSIITYIAGKIRESRGSYSIFKDRNINFETVDLTEGSIYDFSAITDSEAKCFIPEEITEINLKKNRLVVSSKVTKPISLFCSVDKNGLLELLNVRINPNSLNRSTINLSSSEKIANIADIKVMKPSDDAITIETSDSPVVLKGRNNKVIIGKSIFNFSPDGLQLKEPLILELPQYYFNGSGNLYLVNKNGIIKRLEPIVENGTYYVRIPHFSLGVYGVEFDGDALAGSSEITSATVDWTKLKELLLSGDKQLFSYDEDSGIYAANILTKHGYSFKDLSDNLDVSALLSLIILKNGKGALDFDGSTLSFDDNSIVIDYNPKQQASEQQSNEIIYYANLLLKFSNLLYAIEDNRQGIEKLIKRISQDISQDINTVSQSMHEIHQGIQTYVQQQQEVLQNYLQQQEAPQNYKIVLQNFVVFQRSLLLETDIFKKFDMLLDKAIYYQTRSWDIPKGQLSEYQLILAEINYMLPITLKALRGQPERFVRMKAVLYLYKMELLFKNEVEHNVSFKNYLIAKGIVKSYAALEKSIKKMNDILKRMHNLLQNSSDFTKEKVLPLLSSLNKEVSPLASKALDKILKPIKIIGKHSAPVGFFLKYYAVALNYRFDYFSKKIRVLEKLKEVFPEYKSEIDSVENKLVKGYNLDYPFLKQIYVIYLTYLSNDFLQGASVTLDILQTLEGYNVISKYLFRFDKELAPTVGSIASIFSSVVNAANTWTGANALAYLSATASTLAYKAVNNSSLSENEGLKWYAIFQTISNYALASWYYYQGKIAEKSHGLLFDILSNALDAGASIAANPTTLGFVDAVVKAWTNEQIIAAAWSIKHGINFWSKTSGEEDALIADYLSRNAVYQLYATGRVESLLKNKHDIALPPLNIYQTPDGYRIFSLPVKKGTFDRISIRLDKTDSNTYVEDLATGNDTHAHTIYWNFRNEKHDLLVVNKGVFGAILDPTESGIINFVVGKNIKAVEILGWKHEPSGTTPYYTYIDLSRFVIRNVNANRIGDFIESVQNKFQFNFEFLTLQDLDNLSRFIVKNKFSVINLQNGGTFQASEDSLKDTNYWIAVKYFNHSFFGVVFVRINDKIYYEIRDFIFDKKIGNLGELGDYDDIIAMRHSFNELISEANINTGVFSASYLQTLFPNLTERVEALRQYVASYIERSIIVKDTTGGVKSSYVKENNILLDSTVSSVDVTYKLGFDFKGYPEVCICSGSSSKGFWHTILNSFCVSSACEKFTLKWKFSCNNDSSICLSWDKEQNQITISFKKQFIEKLLNSSYTQKVIEIYFHDSSNDNLYTIAADSIKFSFPHKILSTPLIESFEVSNPEQCRNTGYCTFNVAIDGPITNYIVDFGDENQKESNATSLSSFEHKYEQSGNYKVTLKVCNKELCSQKSIEVKINKEIAEPILRIKKVTVSPQIITLKENETGTVTLSLETEAKNVRNLVCKYEFQGSQHNIDCNGNANIKINSSNEGTNKITVYAFANDANGNSLQASDTVTFTVKITKKSYVLRFLGENYKDNSIVNINDGDTIEKHWKLRMSPTHGATLVFEEDTSKTCNLAVTGSLPSIKVGANEEFTVFINFAMPSQEGDYECHFKIKDTDGHYYKIGDKDNIWIKIKVKANDLIASANLSANEIFTNNKIYVIAKVHEGNPPYNITVNWGDGSNSFEKFDEAITIGHTYSQEGTYPVKVTITDNVGKQFIKTMSLKVSSQPDMTTEWKGTLHLTENGVSVDKDFNIVVTEKTDNYTYYEYSSSYVPSQDEVYYVQYDLPVPPEVIDLKNKFRMTFIVRSGEVPYYDREIWLTTNKRKYGVVFINKDYYDLVQKDSAYGQLISKNLETGEIKTNYYPEFSDACEANSISVYAIEMDGDNLTVYRYSNSTYQELVSYPDDTGDYLTKIGFNFRGSGKIILIKFEYDEDGNGCYDDGYLVLNTEDKKVDWSKWAEEGEDEGSENPQDYSSVISGKVIADSVPSNLKIRITPDVEQVDGKWGGIVCQVNSDGTFGDRCVLHGDINNFSSDHTFQIIVFEDVDNDWHFNKEEEDTIKWDSGNATFNSWKEIILNVTPNNKENHVAISISKSYYIFPSIGTLSLDSEKVPSSRPKFSKEGDYLYIQSSSENSVVETTIDVADIYSPKFVSTETYDNLNQLIDWSNILVKIYAEGNVTDISHYENTWKIFEGYIERTISVVYSENNYLYTYTDGKLDIIDILDTDNPKKISSINLGKWETFPFSLSDCFQKSGNYIYILFPDEAKVKVFDLSVITNPVMINDIDFSNLFNNIVGDIWDHSILSFFVHKNKIFLGILNSNIQVIDITDLQNPKYMGYISNTWDATAIKVYGDYLYSYCTNTGAGDLTIANLKTAYNVLSSIALDDGSDIAIKGDYAFVSSGNAGYFGTSDIGKLYVINVSDPYNPSILTNISTHNALGVFINDDYLYLADGDAGLKIVDISDPENPFIANSLHSSSTYTAQWNVQDIYIYGDQAFLAVGPAGFVVLDISDQKNIEKVSEGNYYDIGGIVENIYANKKFTIIGGINGLKILYPSGIAASTLYIEGVDDMCVKDNFVYLSSLDFGSGNPDSRLIVVNINNITNPKIIGSLKLSVINDMEIYKDKIYIATPHSLLVVDISDSYSPKIVGRITDPDYENENCLVKIHIDNGYIYVVGCKYLRILKPVNF